jgi:hypothetical protein
MKADAYKLLDECVDIGIIIGNNRAHKHENNPSMDTINHCIHTAVMQEICEWFNFDNDEITVYDEDPETLLPIPPAHPL